MGISVAISIRLGTEDRRGKVSAADSLHVAWHLCLAVGPTVMTLEFWGRSRVQLWRNSRICR